MVRTSLPKKGDGENKRNDISTKMNRREFAIDYIHHRELGQEEINSQKGSFDWTRDSDQLSISNVQGRRGPPEQVDGSGMPCLNLA
ncbi:hypothetical protein D5086_011770 [Populus alba]|uniref:Uncharacterized protein n=1 Tax=Populus alba TaxID=43335 RepID=A0ACC4CES1_POPAL